MSDKFPKQYVLDRIAARKGTLELKVKQDQEVLDRAKEGQIGTLDDILKKNLDMIENLSKAAKKAKKAYDSAETYDEKRKVLATISGHLSLASLPYEYSTPKRERGSDKRTMADVKNDLSEARTELGNLEHARLHLTEMPVTEFSLASLKSLGLLSALKFDLNEAIRRAAS